MAQEQSDPIQFQLREKLREHFSESDLRDLCFRLGIDYEELSGDNKKDKVRELIFYLERRGRLPELVNICSELRPAVDWLKLIAENTPTSDQEAIPAQSKKAFWEKIKPSRVIVILIVSVVILISLVRISLNNPDWYLQLLPDSISTTIPSSTPTETSTPTLTTIPATPTPTVTNTPTASSTPTPTNTPQPTVRVISDFNDGIQGWMPAKWSDGETALSVSPSSEIGVDGALLGIFDYRNTKANFARATFYLTMLSNADSNDIHDWSLANVLQFEAKFLRGTSGSIKVNVMVKTQEQGCYYRHEMYQTVPATELKSIEFHLSANWFPDDCSVFRQGPLSLVGMDEVLELALVFIPNPDNARFEGAVLIDNVWLIEP